MPGTKPLDRYGRSKCAVFQSAFHWAKHCPHKGEQVKLTEGNNTNEVEECNITVYTKESQTEAEIFMTECFGSPIIDTARTRTVCGQEWLNSYITGLNQNKLNDLKKRPFRSSEKLKIPAKNWSDKVS